MKILVILLLLAMVVSLAFGLFFLGSDKQGSTRMLKALKLRVVLSVSLIVLLIAAYYFGLIAPQGAT